jgi:hypothetical protein
MARQRLTVDQAATALGISTDAVRKRARRGTLESDKDADGTVYVWLDGGTPDGAPGGPSPTQAHLDSLEAQLEYLQQIIDIRDRELAEMRRLLAGALERIPELEPPQDARESPVSASEKRGGGGVSPEQEKHSERSWWRRFFGLENPA